jgi:hypothetical protein
MLDDRRRHRNWELGGLGLLDGRGRDRDQVGACGEGRYYE